MLVEHPWGKKHEYHAEGDWIDDHLLGIELKILFVSGAYTSNTDYKESHHLRVKEVTILIDVH